MLLLYSLTKRSDESKPFLLPSRCSSLLSFLELPSPSRFDRLFRALPVVETFYRRSLEELVIEGYPTNAALAHLIMHDGEFVRGQYDTSFLDRNLPRLLELARTCDTLTAE